MSIQSGYANRMAVSGCSLLLSSVLIYCAGRDASASVYSLEIEGVPQSDVSALSFSNGVEKARGGVLIHGELRVSKPVDAASPLLLQLACSTQELSKVDFRWIQTEGPLTRNYRLTVRDALVGSYVQRTSVAGETPTEEVLFNYSEIEWSYIQTGLDGTGLWSGATKWERTTETGGPTDPDSDDDGIPDSYEVQEGLKPLVDDADDDADDDGMSNRDESDAGTLAGDPESIFKVTGLIRPTAGGVLYTVTFNSVPGRTYQLHVTESLSVPFQPVLTVDATDPVTSVELVLPQLRAFVKVVVLPL